MCAQVLISVNPENLLDAETLMCGSILNVTFAISQERTRLGRGVMASLGLNAESDTVANELHFEAGQNAGVSMHWARMNPKKYEC